MNTDIIVEQRTPSSCNRILHFMYLISDELLRLKINRLGTVDVYQLLIILKIHQ